MRTHCIGLVGLASYAAGTVTGDTRDARGRAWTEGRRVRKALRTR